MPMNSALDYVGFWEIVAAVKQLDLSSSKEEQFNEVISIVKCLLHRNLRVFNFKENSNDLNLWIEPSATAVIERIKQEWVNLPGEVGLGDVCWFTRVTNNNI